MIEYNGNDNELKKLHNIARDLCEKYNKIPNKNNKNKNKILIQLLNNVGNNVVIHKPFMCDIGKNIIIGNNVFINYNCVILDIEKVRIGDNTLLGPNVNIYTPFHSLEIDSRKKKDGFASPVVIESNCWIGGNVTILPNVTIGEGCVVGAGSVVTKNLEKYSVYAGNPAKLIKRIGVKTNE